MHEHENRTFEITKPYKQKEKGIKKSGETLRDLWGSIEQTDIYIVGILEGKVSDKGT